mmetsp:Transcript_7533/g.9841  ORF Transcript_7533/g.9841 Transcript_7533/m.9841 type:complete len:182 (-) Transcript_7533:47-592(-)
MSPNISTTFDSLNLEEAPSGIVDEGARISSGFAIPGKFTHKTMVLLTLNPSVGPAEFRLISSNEYRAYKLEDFSGSVEMQVIEEPKEVVDLTADSDDDEVQEASIKIKKEEEKENNFETTTPKHKFAGSAPRGKNGCFSPFSDSSVEIEKFDDSELDSDNSEIDSDPENEFEETQQESFPF